MDIKIRSIREDGSYPLFRQSQDAYLCRDVYNHALQSELSERARIIDLPATLRRESLVCSYFRVESPKFDDYELSLSLSLSLSSRWNMRLSSGSSQLTLPFCFIFAQSIPDVPWRRASTYRGPAVVQLATPESSLVVHLFHSNGKPSFACARVLEAVLNDPNIVKAGCRIDDDMLELAQSWFHVHAQSRFDLRGIGATSSKQPVGLKTLASHILGVQLPKSRKLAMSDWGRLPLTKAQLAYCARDAWAGAAIVEKLARLDPATFSPEALVNRLQRTERPIQEVFERHRTRKRCKRQITNLVLPYKQSKSRPLSVVESVAKLKQTMKANEPDRMILFDVDPLGFELTATRR